MQKRNPGNPVKSIDVIGDSIGNGVRICVTNTHIKEVEELISETWGTGEKCPIIKQYRKPYEPLKNLC